MWGRLRARVRVGAVVALIAGFSLAAAAPGHVLAGGSIGPRQMLVTYYSLINARDYGNAFNQWVTPPSTYQEFVQGYADTAYVKASFGSFQVGTIGGLVGRVPGVLIGTHTNNALVAYAGCYEVAYNSAATGLAQWRITTATFQQLSYIPNADQITALNSGSCYGQFTPGDVYGSVQSMLVDYVSAVNLGNYARAYSMWAYPQQTYQQFVAGWADTVETVLFYGGYRYGGPYAGAEIGRVPVVMLGYHTDGSLAAYYGCIGVSYNANTGGRWGIYNAYLYALGFVTTPDSYTVAQVLNAACY